MINMEHPGHLADTDGVSVIVCCYNSAARLPETLRHLAQQQVPESLPWEVIVVNNASSDNTAQVAAKLWQELGNPTALRVVDEPVPGLSWARERGIACAQYPILVFVDDDNWLAEDYVRVAGDVMQQKPEAAVMGANITAQFESPPPAWFEQVQFMYAIGAQGPHEGDITETKPHVAGAGMVLRKAAFNELKRHGFKPVLSDRQGAVLSAGGDYELCYALALMGWRIWYDARLRLTHSIPAQRVSDTYIWRLADGIRRAGPAFACYEIALRGTKVRPLRFYFRRVSLLGWWLLKGAVKFFLGRESWVALRIAFADWQQSLCDYGELQRVLDEHLPRVLKLKSERLGQA